MALLAAVAATGVYLVVQDLDGPSQEQLAWRGRVSSLAVDLDDIVRRAEMLVPQGTRVSLAMPTGPSGLYRFDTLVGDTLVHVLFDQRSGDVAGMDRTRGRSLGDRLSEGAGQLHYGRVFGTPSRVLWLALSLTPGLLFVIGVSMWWARSGARRFRQTP